MCLLTSPLVLLWQRPTLVLDPIESVVAMVSVVSALLVTSLFTGFLSPLAGGLSLQIGYVEPLVGEGFIDYDQVRGLGIAVWTVAILVAAFTVLLARFRISRGLCLVGCALIGLPGLFLTGEGSLPMAVGFVAAGVALELATMVFTRPLGRAGASLTGAFTGATLWAATFAALAADNRMHWSEALWGGAVTLSALVGAATAGLVTLSVRPDLAQDPATSPPART